jgi:hypothetical protein
MQARDFFYIYDFQFDFTNLYPLSDQKEHKWNIIWYNLIMCNKYVHFVAYFNHLKSLQFASE